VGYHLHKIFSKLGIASRAGLAEVDLDEVDLDDDERP
jgi:hypothetical protein